MDTNTTTSLTNEILYGASSTTHLPDYTTTLPHLTSPASPSPTQQLDSPHPSPPVLITPINDIEAKFLNNNRRRNSNTIDVNIDKVRRATALVEAHKSAWKKVVPHPQQNASSLDEQQSLETIATVTTMTTDLETVVTADDAISPTVRQHPPFVSHDAAVSTNGDSSVPESPSSPSSSDSSSAIDDNRNIMNDSILKLVDDSLIGWEKEQTEWEEKEARLERDLANWGEQQDQQPPTVIGDNQRMLSPIYGIPETPTQLNTTDDTDNNDNTNDNNNWEQNQSYYLKIQKTAFEKEKDDWRKAFLREQMTLLHQNEKDEWVQRTADLKALEAKQRALDESRTKWEEEKACLEQRTVELEGVNAALEETNLELVERLKSSVVVVVRSNDHSEPCEPAIAAATPAREIVRIPKPHHRTILPAIVWPIRPLSMYSIYRPFLMAQTSFNGWVVNTYETSRSFRQRVWRMSKGVVGEVLRIHQRGMGGGGGCGKRQRRINAR